MAKINNPVRDLTPHINEIESCLTTEEIQKINDILASVKPMTPEEIEEFLNPLPKSSDD